MWLCWSHWHKQHAQAHPTSVQWDSGQVCRQGLQNLILMSLSIEIAFSDDKPCFSSKGDAGPLHHTAPTKSCYPTDAAISVLHIFSTRSSCYRQILDSSLNIRLFHAFFVVVVKKNLVQSLYCSFCSTIFMSQL